MIWSARGLKLCTCFPRAGSSRTSSNLARRGNARNSGRPPPLSAVKLERTFRFPMPAFALLPMLNVLFLVLVFFTLGTRFILQPGVQVILPTTTFALGPQRNGQIVSLTAAPVPAIYF